MPSINTASTAGIHARHEHALKSPAAHKAKRPHTSPRPPSETATEMRETPDKSRAKGVLRLLEEGHFKGVAAVRLRMNFHAELAQKDAAEQTGAARAAAMQLQTGMAGILDANRDQIGENLVEPVEAVFSQFDQAVANSLDDEAAASDIHAAAAAAIETLKSGIVSLFEPGDVSAIQDASTPGGTGDAPTDVAGDVGETDDATGTAASASSLLQHLLDDIDQLAAAFEVTADSAIQVAGIEDIIAPSGNGVAFEKFVEQYQARFESSAEQIDEPRLIDEHA